jgi:hypothetical protein
VFLQDYDDEEEQLSSESGKDFSKSGTKTAESSFVDTEDIENLIPKIPSYVRSGFRQNHDDSLLSTSPNSPDVDDDDEDSPLTVSGDTSSLAASEALFDVEEYAVDIIANAKKSEVKIPYQVIVLALRF